MKPPTFLLVTYLCALVANCPADQGPAGSGACARVFGPVDIAGNPIGFTCEDVGGTALLVWNASQIDSQITVSGGISTVNFHPGALNFSGVFTSDGPVAFIGGGINISGSITGSSVLVLGADTTDTEIKSTLLSGSRRITASTTVPVTVEASGTITATGGNLSIGGASVINKGQLSAQKGMVSLTAGTKVDAGWDDVAWVEGIKIRASSGPFVTNNGTITAKDIKLEANRRPGTFITVRNLGALNATNTVTIVTGAPGTQVGTAYVPGTFGIFNAGKIKASNLVISPYSTDTAGALANRTFNLNQAADRGKAQLDIGGTVSGTAIDNTPTNPNTPVIDSTRNSGAFTTTSTIVVPQLAASMSHMNATQQPVGKTLAVTSTSDPVRGAGKPATTTSNKPRPKAKPVLVRGAFFGTKISATLSSR